MSEKLGAETMIDDESRATIQFLKNILKLPNVKASTVITIAIEANCCQVQANGIIKTCERYKSTTFHKIFFFFF